MGRRRFVDFLPDLPGEIALGEKHYRHLVRVLRMKIGECVTLFDGSGREAISKITNISPGSVSVEIDQIHQIRREPNCKITLAFAMTKGQKPDFILQKGVELGVSSFFLFTSDRSVARIPIEKLESRRERWEGIIEAACTQSGHNYRPGITFFHDTFQMLQSVRTSIRLCMNPEGDRSIMEFKNPLPEEITVMVGPEGGFSDREIEAALENNFFMTRMTQGILRAETAAITAVVPFVLE